MATNPFVGDSPPPHYLREWRIKRGLSREVLAQKLGTTRQTLSRWESFERGLSLEVLWRLFDELDIMPGQFFAPPETPDLNVLVKDATPLQRRQILHDVKRRLEKA